MCVARYTFKKGVLYDVDLYRFHKISFLKKLLELIFFTLMCQFGCLPKMRMRVVSQEPFCVARWWSWDQCLGDQWWDPWGAGVFMSFPSCSNQTRPTKSSAQLSKAATDWPSSPLPPHPSSWLGLAVSSNTTLPRAGSPVLMRLRVLPSSAVCSLPPSLFPQAVFIHTHTPCTPHTLTTHATHTPHTYTTYTTPAFL